MNIEEDVKQDLWLQEAFSCGKPDHSKEQSVHVGITLHGYTLNYITADLIYGWTILITANVIDDWTLE